jgi:hypothetical protein
MQFRLDLGLEAGLLLRWGCAPVGVLTMTIHMAIRDNPAVGAVLMDALLIQETYDITRFSNTA